MKLLTIFISAFLFSFITFAQDKLPSFGKIDKSDLEMKDCDFDPGSEAIVLIDLGEIWFSYVQNVGWVSEADYRVRIKVLKASAIHRAEIKLQYFAKDSKEEISGVHGVSYNLDGAGNIEKAELEKNSIYRKSIDNNFSEIAFALPQVKMGSVFEYKYKITRKSYSYIPSWRFQQSIPVKYSAYNIRIPEYFHFTTQIIKRQEIEKQKSDAFDDGNWYIMRNVPGLKIEPFSSGTKDYLQRIEFQLSKIEAPSYYEEVRTTWPKIIDELLEDEDFGLAIKKNIKGTGDLDIQLLSARSIKEKVRLVYNYVQKNMRWNNEYNKYTDHGIKEAWDKKNGNIADINFILIRLLRDAGVHADPLIASTKDNGTINMFYPFLSQFNCSLAYVKDGDNQYIMNAADKYCSFNLVPPDVLFTNGLLVNKNEGRIIQLVSDSIFSNIIKFNCNVNGGGKLSGEATISSYGYARNDRMDTYKKGTLNEMLEDNEGVSIKVDSTSFDNVNEDLLPLEQKLLFNGNIQSSGEYLFLPYNVFTGLGKNQFIEENRVMDIDFDFPKSIVVSGTYNLADEYIVTGLPKNTKMILPDTSISLIRITQQDGNIVTFKLKLECRAYGYGAESYPYIKEYFKKMYDMMDERIVLKKK